MKLKLISNELGLLEGNSNEAKLMVAARTRTSNMDSKSCNTAHIEAHIKICRSLLQQMKDQVRTKARENPESMLKSAEIQDYIHIQDVVDEFETLLRQKATDKVKADEIVTQTSNLVKAIHHQYLEAANGLRTATEELSPSHDAPNLEAILVQSATIIHNGRIDLEAQNEALNQAYRKFSQLQREHSRTVLTKVQAILELLEDFCRQSLEHIILDEALRHEMAEQILSQVQSRLAEIQRVHFY